MELFAVGRAVLLGSVVKGWVIRCTWVPVFISMGVFATMQRCPYEPGFHVLVVFKGFFSV